MTEPSGTNRCGWGHAQPVTSEQAVLAMPWAAAALGELGEGPANPPSRFSQLHVGLRFSPHKTIFKGNRSAV